MALLEIRDLHVSVEGKEILKGVSLDVDRGEVTAIMGPNGSGKSTLALALSGHPKYKISSGKILFGGEDISQLSPHKRAQKGILLGFQYPAEISGVTLSNFLRAAYNSRKQKTIPVMEFSKLLTEKMEMLGMEKSFMNRYVNEGFSGGEKKRTEILQMAVLEPTLAVLDETDSGLDIDALRMVADSINKLANQERGILIITHYRRLLNYVKPSRINIMIDGRIVMKGDDALAQQLEAKGYAWVKQKIAKTVN